MAYLQHYASERYQVKYPNDDESEMLLSMRQAYTHLRSGARLRLRSNNQWLDCFLLPDDQMVVEMPGTKQIVKLHDNREGHKQGYKGSRK